MTENKKTWFITGTSTGFGRAFVEYALARGYNVVATARKVEALADLLAKAPGRVLALPLDVTKPGAAEDAIEAAIARFGGIDVLINNAGFALVGAVEETPMAEWRKVMETNFFGALAVTQAALPHFRAAGKGAIVNISSLGGQLSFAGFGAYSATKFALEGMSEGLALELAPLGIKVLIVEPGAFRTSLAGANMPHMPKIAAYDQSVGPIRDFAHGMDGTQAGDPLKATAAIDEALNSTKTPLRLQLGADAVDSVRTHAELLLADLAAWEKVARATALDA